MPNYQERGMWFSGEKDSDGHGEGTKMTVQIQYFWFHYIEGSFFFIFVSSLHFFWVLEEVNVRDRQL